MIAVTICRRENVDAGGVVVDEPSPPGGDRLEHRKSHPPRDRSVGLGDLSINRAVQLRCFKLIIIKAVDVMMRIQHRGSCI